MYLYVRDSKKRESGEWRRDYVSKPTCNCVESAAIYERDKLSMSVRKRQLEIITRWRFMLDSNSEPRTILLPYSHSLNNVQQRS